MKQLLLIAFFAVASFYAKAQVIFYVETPESLEGDYEMTWSNPANGWGSPDLNITDNSVTCSAPSQSSRYRRGIQQNPSRFCRCQPYEW